MMLRGLFWLFVLFVSLLFLGALTFWFIYTAGTNPHALPQPILDFAQWMYASSHAATPTASPVAEAGDNVAKIVMAIGMGAFLIAFYFLPTIVGRHRRNAPAIFLLNLLLGWTLLGWVIALVWAATTDQSSTNTTSSSAAMPR
jgi:hypothetical protein